jgi:hypothetical protein
MRRMSLLLLSTTLALVASACAGLKPAATADGTVSPSASPITTTFAPGDAGKVIRVNVGGQLVFQPPGSRQYGSIVAWAVVSYPKNILSLENGESRQPPFRFLVQRPGTGTIQITFGPKCLGGPRPGQGPDCPLLGPASAAPIDAPIQLYNFPIRAFAGL